MLSDKDYVEDTIRSSLQSGNKTWWTKNTMSYDWQDRIGESRFSRAWFDEADRRFIESAKYFAHKDQPFDLIIPFPKLEAKRVLEIGCGMGLHSELLARSGALLTAIDISPTSVAATKARFQLKGLKGEIVELDAEQLCRINEFDFVWSWGVIHHSSRTAKIIGNIYHCLKPGGEARIMVYHRDGMQAYSIIVLKYLFGFWCGRGLDQYLWRSTDGHIARYYTKDLLADIVSVHTDDFDIAIYGLQSDAIPLPGRLRKLASWFVPSSYITKAVHRRGSFLFLTMRKPLTAIAV